MIQIAIERLQLAGSNSKRNTDAFDSLNSHPNLVVRAFVGRLPDVLGPLTDTSGSYCEVAHGTACCGAAQ